MHKIFTLALLSATMAMGAVGYAQTNLPAHKVNQNKNWMFGNKLSLDFNSGVPVVGTSKITRYYGGSSISDANGQLLMYANRDTIWDKMGNPMPNGAGNLTNNPAAPSPPLYLNSQDDSRIAPVINNPNRYYVFSKTSSYSSLQVPPPGNDSGAGRMYYSVVDMTLNGGLGDVVPGMKKIMLDSLVTDRSIVVKGNNCNAWLLTLHYYPPGSPGGLDTILELHAFEINANGINPNPIVSPINSLISPGYRILGMIGAQATSSAVGQMLASPDNSKLAISMAGLVPPYGGGFLLFDFNNNTGIASNQITVTPSGSGFFGPLSEIVSDICFSPDNTKLYTAQGIFGGLFQYDITTGGAAAMISSRVNLNTGGIGWLNGMRLGPDDKIYIAGVPLAAFSLANGVSIHRIENPNLSGVAAALTLNAIMLPPGERVLLGLGAATIDRSPMDSIYSVHNLFLCAEDPSLNLSVPYDSRYSYQWNDGVDTNDRIITQPGDYWVKYGTFCEVRADTFHILPLDLTPHFGPRDTIICGALESPMQLQLNVVPGANYLWQDGSTNPNYTITDSGTYYVTITKAQCIGTDTITVHAYNVYQELGNDTVVCEKTPFQITLEARVPAGASVLWSTGQTSDSIQVTDPGTYTVTVSQDICSSSDSVTISTERCDCITFMPNAFSPNGDGLNDVFAPQFETGCEITGYSLQVFNRYGQRVFETIKPGAGWNGTHNGTPVDPGTYMFTISYDKGTQHHAYILKGDLTLIR